MSTDEDVVLSIHAPQDLTDEALAKVNRLHDIAHPRRPVPQPSRDEGSRWEVVEEIPAIVEGWPSDTIGGEANGRMSA